MRYGISIVIALAAALAAAPIADAMLADVPLEIIAGKSDLIVIAEVLQAGEPVEMEVILPGMEQARKGFYRTYDLKITRVLKEKGAKPTPVAAKPAEGKAAPAPKPLNRRIEIVAAAQAPQPPGVLRPMVSDAYFANLRVGQSYVLLLNKRTGKIAAGQPQYFLSSYPRNVHANKPDAVKTVMAAADTSKWAWGQAHKGLQIAVKMRNTEVKLVQSVQRKRLPNGKMGPAVKKKLAYLSPVIALRNVSRKSITVSLYPSDKFLSLSVVGPGGQALEPDWYGYLDRQKAPPYDVARNQRTIQPGEVLFAAPYGEANYGMGTQMELRPGKWLVTAGLDAKRKVAGADGKPVWVGDVVSKPVEVTVKP